jgi:hypothetical protein
MKDDLNFNLEDAGFLSVLPYVAVFFVTIGGGRASDWILAKGANRHGCHSNKKLIFQNSCT